KVKTTDKKLLYLTGERIEGQTSEATTSSTDPCSTYTVLDNSWRDVHYEPNGDHDDSLIEWDGWYRLYLNGESAQLSEWCVSNTNCGGHTALYLSGSHPQLDDGVVTREVLGYHPRGECDNYRSTPIQLKAFAFNSLTNDPCFNYQSLDRPWRATNESGTFICEEYFSWSGWYRLFYNGMDIRMPESCVNLYSCNGFYSLWLNGPHPKIEDGVVMQAAVNLSVYPSGSKPVQAITVYEFVNQSWCSSYCIGTVYPPFFPLNNLWIISLFFNILDDQKKSPNDFFIHHNTIYGYDDINVEWDGWYRLQWCFRGYSSLWLGGPHPQLEDGVVVTCEVYGSDYEECNYYRSNPIQVKACPGNYYVYELIRPHRMIPAPAYCAGAVNFLHIVQYFRNCMCFCHFLIFLLFYFSFSLSFYPPSFDPCYSYNSRDEPWRANTIPVTNFSNARCDYDVNWNGWYRLFYNGQSVQMPDSCVSSCMCGTNSPLWLNGPHPQLEDGVVTRQVCASTWNDCCGYKSPPIRVKACPGNYYVYEFVRPLYCSAYCAVFVISPVVLFCEGDPCHELNCTENEWCEEGNHHRPQHDSFDFIETCESSSGSMSLSRCQLFEAGFPSDILHLNDPSCRGTVWNDRVESYFDNNEHICGTNLVANGTHFIYDNFIVGEPNLVGHHISREIILKLSFSFTVHMNLPVAQGTYQVRMIPYQDAEFSHPFTGSVNAELNEHIFVEVCVDGVDSRQFASVIDTCWATPVNDPHYPLLWDLIVDMCPSPNDKVELLMFIFIANSTKIYLHCAIHLCLLTDNNCVQVSRAPTLLCASLMMILISMISVLIFF
uniref:Si:dkey-239b22.2 n=1 Tax=Sinocyclocheilus grahami TaxID=75366 RepID=A0A672NUD5_SINGR